jgi:hypothetical protein
VMSGPQAAFVASSVFVLFVLMSQALVSLAGRAVPLPALDRVWTSIHHRTGALRAVGLIWTAGIGAATQALAVFGIANADNQFARLAFGAEVVLAVRWTIVLAAVARRRSARGVA